MPKQHDIGPAHLPVAHVQSTGPAVLLPSDLAAFSDM